MYIPQTIEDAIQVVRAIAKRHLWVDQLFIVLNEDKASQDANIERMDQIYNYAMLTIAAIDDMYADEGLN